MTEYAAADGTNLESFQRHDRLIRSGQCPNGCGLLQPMGESKPYTLEGEQLQSCGTCGFFTNVQPDRGVVQ